MLLRNDIIYVAKSKAGLSLLTMFLSRAELLKQGGGALQGLAPCTPEEMAHWEMLYQQLYDRLHDQFLTFFPPPVILPGNNQAINAVHLANNADDTYVWQFLAAIAVGASMEQQHSLVTEVRDRVMEDIVMASSNRLPAEQAAHKISNVNLFLHALGLDASQVTVPV
jgi:DNA topoisomerase 2-associated protein PAT1